MMGMSDLTPWLLWKATVGLKSNVLTQIPPKYS